MHGCSLGGRPPNWPSMLSALGPVFSDSPRLHFLLPGCGVQAAFSPRPSALLSFLWPHHKTVTCLGSGYTVQLGHSTLLASSTPP